MNQQNISIDGFVKDLQEQIKSVNESQAQQLTDGPLNLIVAQQFLEKHQLEETIPWNFVKETKQRRTIDFIYYILKQLTNSENEELSKILSQYSDNQLNANLIHILKIESKAVEQQQRQPLDIRLQFKSFEMGLYRIKLHIIGDGSLWDIHLNTLQDSLSDFDDYWTAFKQFIINLNEFKEITLKTLCLCNVFVTKQQYGKNGIYGRGSQFRLSDAPAECDHEKKFIEKFHMAFLKDQLQFPQLDRYPEEQQLVKLKQWILWGETKLKPYYEPQTNPIQKLEIKFQIYSFYFAEQIISYIPSLRFDNRRREQLLFYYCDVAIRILKTIIQNNNYRADKKDPVRQKQNDIRNLQPQLDNNLEQYLEQYLEQCRNIAIETAQQLPSNSVEKFRMLCLINEEALQYNQCLQTFRLYSQNTAYKLGVTPTQIELVLKNPKYNANNQSLISDLIRQQLNRLNTI